MTFPRASNATCQSAPRAVSATSSEPSEVNARPFATMFCGLGASGGCRVELWRPTPTLFAIGGTRKSSTAVPPAGPTRKTRPWFVPPSDAYRLPLASNARPLAPGVPLAKMDATGGAAAFGVSTAIASPVAPEPLTYRLP